MSFSVAGKTAIVTGAANGIGLAIARQFAENEANVVFADMDEDGLALAVGNIGEEGGNIRSFAGDLRQKLNIANLLSVTIDAFERVDILINAARQVAPTDPFDADDTTVEMLMEQNVLASLRLSQLVARRMIKQDADGDARGGSIINLSSTAGQITHPDLLGYSIAAAAMNQMTRSLALTLAQKKIRVNAIAFGSVLSASLQRRLKDEGHLRDAIEEGTPLGRVAEAAEIADAAQFLASEGSGFITGQVLTVDGGRTLLDPVRTEAH